MLNPDDAMALRLYNTMSAQVACALSAELFAEVMDLTFFSTRAKWRPSQSLRRGVSRLCLTGVDIVRDGVTSRFHSLTRSQ